MMRQEFFGAAAAALLSVLAVTGAHGQEETATPYARMAPLEQYLMARDAEIAMARSAAPESISKDATILVLERDGYKTAASKGGSGGSGFVCMVQRSWTAGSDDPEFWNPKLRAPICLNPPAARTVLPLVIKKTEWILAGRSKSQMFDSVSVAYRKKELPDVEAGAMCYMMSRQGYLSDRVGAWHPHLMFFVPHTEPGAWGADLPGSPLMGSKDSEARMTVFMIKVNEWSDGGKHE